MVRIADELEGMGQKIGGFIRWKNGPLHGDAADYPSLGLDVLEALKKKAVGRAALTSSPRRGMEPGRISHPVLGASLERPRPAPMRDRPEGAEVAFAEGADPVPELFLYGMDPDER